jgi:predicted Zn-dependent protease
MKPNVDLHSFLFLVRLTGGWEAYVQGRQAIHVEYGNIHSTEPKLKLTPISKWGGRITAFDRGERFIVEGYLQEQALHGNSVVSTLSGDFHPPEETHTLREEIGAKIDPSAVPAEELWQQIRYRLEWLIERLQSEPYQIKVWCGWEFRGYYNSLRSTMTSLFPLSKLKVSVKIAEGGLIKRIGMREGVEFFDNIPRALMEDFLHDVQQAKIAKKGEPIPRVIVLDPEAMSMFIHETVGHSSEGDHVQAGESYLPAFRGKRIAPPGVTIVDSPTRFSTLGSYPFDDEGTLPQTVYVLEDGVVRDYLTDRTSSTSLHVKPTGNSRSFWYDATPKVRMTNFAMLPGTSSLESILSGVNDGLFIKGMIEGGSNERTGDFHFRPNIAYKVRGGELKEPILIPEIKGNALDYLEAITEVSSEWSLCVAGCGKPTPQTDYVWVGYGAPFAKFDRRL